MQFRVLNSFSCAIHGFGPQPWRCWDKVWNTVSLFLILWLYHGVSLLVWLYSSTIMLTAWENFLSVFVCFPHTFSWHRKHNGKTHQGFSFVGLLIFSQPEVEAADFDGLASLHSSSSLLLKTVGQSLYMMIYERLSSLWTKGRRFRLCCASLLSNSGDIFYTGTRRFLYQENL